MCGGRDLGFVWARSRGGSWGSVECFLRDGGIRRIVSDFLLCYLGFVGSYFWEGRTWFWGVILGRGGGSRVE